MCHLATKRGQIATFFLKNGLQLAQEPLVEHLQLVERVNNNSKNQGNLVEIRYIFSKNQS